MKLSGDVCVIIAAAGSGERAALGYNKTLWRSGADSVIRRCVLKFGFAKKVVVACKDTEKEAFLRELEGIDNVIIAEGGATRSESVRKALSLCDGKITLVHDGARPNVSDVLIERVVSETEKYGSAVPCTTADLAMKRKSGYGFLSVDRSEYLFVQTPQGFYTDQLKKAYAEVAGDYADDSEVWEKSGRTVNVVEGERENVKLTYPFQFVNGDGLRVGTGYDVHALVSGRKLVLGGVEVNFDKGLLGHSDADVLTHAVMDALLSAAGLPDIGVLFPDTDDSLSGISSMILLDRVAEKLADWKIINVSAVIMAQKPRLAEVIPDIRKNLADRLDLQLCDVNVSATTTEKLGIVGNMQGMAASATVLIQKRCL